MARKEYNKIKYGRFFNLSISRMKKDSEEEMCIKIAQRKYDMNIFFLLKET